MVDTIAVSDVALERSAKRRHLGRRLSGCSDEFGSEFSDRRIVRKQPLHLGAALPKYQSRCLRIQTEQQASNLSPSLKLAPEAFDVVERMRGGVKQVQERKKSRLVAECGRRGEEKQDRRFVGKDAKSRSSGREVACLDPHKVMRLINNEDVRCAPSAI
ncbi:MAG: hypothetical protein ABS84_09595 [Rubrivivax sp. SCN 71-131]|nr:MAG: hypothetical protein ABS84_09595 [Rubrivivax sp. SCN 71-131]